MKTKEFLDKMQEVEDFVNQIYREIPMIKGVSESGYVPIITTPDEVKKGAVTHDRWHFSLCFGSEFNVTIKIDGVEFRGYKHGWDVVINNDSLRNFILNEEKYKEVWEYAKQIPYMSIAEVKIDSLESDIAYTLREIEKRREEVRELKERLAARDKEEQNYE